MKEMENESIITCIAILRIKETNMMAFGLKSGVIQIRKRSNQSLLTTIEMFERGVVALQFTDNGAWLIATDGLTLIQIDLE